jgi:hypothetical protein
MQPKRAKTFTAIFLLLASLLFCVTTQFVYGATTHNVVSLTVAAGTIASGTMANLNIGDSGVLAVNELGSDRLPVLDLRFNFTDMPAVPTSIQVQLYQKYFGSPSHHIGVYAWNFSDATWVQYGTIDNSASYYWVNMTLTGNLTDFVRGGNFTLRMNHLQIGESAHVLYLDTLVLVVNDNFGPSFNNIGFVGGEASEPCLFNAYVTDADPDLSYWVFSSNLSGSWANDSAVYFASGAGGWAYATHVLPPLYGSVVQYKFYAVCSDGNFGVTSTRQLTILSDSAISSEDAIGVALVFGVCAVALAFVVFYAEKRRG